MPISDNEQALIQNGLLYKHMKNTTTERLTCIFLKQHS